MAYSNPTQRRDYQRDYKRFKRAGSCQTPGQPRLPSTFRLKTAQDVLALLGEQVEAVRDDEQAGTMERARTIGYLAGIVLKAVEAADTTTRLEALERAMKLRKDDELWEPEHLNGSTAN